MSGGGRSLLDLEDAVGERCQDHDHDEFEDYLEESLRNAQFRAAYEDSETRSRLLASLVMLRQSLHLTQTQVARRMQTTQSSVSEFESGATDPRLSTLQRYARAVTACLRIRIDMPTDSPWLPADQGAYTRSADVIFAVNGPVREGVPSFASKWRDQSLGKRDDASGNVTVE
jgi:transcriptional regulator with XRE-family HTH domain